MNTLNDKEITQRQEACKTYIEQAKLLTSLASAFIVAPAAILGFTRVSLTWQLLMAEVCFVASVFAGYISIGAIAGSQFEGKYNIHRTAVTWAGRLQSLAYIAGIGLLCWWSYRSYQNGALGLPAPR